MEQNNEKEKDIFGYTENDYDENGMPYDTDLQHEAFENWSIK